MIVLLCCFFMPAVAGKKKNKVGYEFPKEMAAEIQAEYMKICDKGQVLYDITCGSCHNIKEKNKELIPDFLPDQLKGYELRVSNAKHESAMPDDLVTAEELGQIMTFLSYKKKSGVAFVKPTVAAN